jgi:hypothetical protein
MVKYTFLPGIFYRAYLTRLSIILFLELLVTFSPQGLAG